MPAYESAVAHLRPGDNNVHGSRAIAKDFILDRPQAVPHLAANIVREPDRLP
jgi:hypothetical protein